MTTRIVSGLAEIADGYDALLVDVWGVIHNGRAAFPDAVEACKRFRAERGPVVMVSNSPRPGDGLIAQFRQVGAGDDFFDGVATSGDATRAELAARAPGPAYKLGPARDDPLYAGTGLEFAPLEDAAFISCTGLFDDETEGPEDYEEVYAFGVARGLEMVCANPDVTVRRGDKVIYCAGALAEAYAARGGRVVLCGKPHPPIYDLAYRLVDAAAGRQVDRTRILAVGDGPNTDLAGAEAQSLDALFVAQGLHASRFADGFGPEEVAALLGGRVETTAFAAAEMAW